MSVGVEVRTGPPAAAGGGASGDDSTFFVTGITQRGRTNEAVVCRSMSEFIREFGERVTYGTLYDAMQTFFAEGGSRAIVARVIGGAASTGTLALQDRAGVPSPTLTITANGAGSWSSRVSVEVQDDVGEDTFTILVYYDDNLAEQFPLLSSPTDAVAKINNASQYIRVTNAGSTAAAPANNPAVTGPTALSAGDDDRASVTTEEYIAALDLFSSDLGPGVVAVPGQPITGVGTGLVAHAAANGRLVFVAPALGSTIASAISSVTSLRNAPNAERVGVLYPWVTIPDGRGGTRDISPEGYVAGIRARAIAQDGPWRAPAGSLGKGRFVIGTSQVLTTDDVNDLNDAAINPIRTMSGQVVLYGWRSLSLDVENYKFLNAADVLNHIAYQADSRLEELLFRNIDGRGHLFTEVESDIAGILEPIREAGGLYEKEAEEDSDPGYVIDTGEGVNSAASIAAGQINVEVGVRISSVGELIRITISKVAVTADL